MPSESVPSQPETLSIAERILGQLGSHIAEAYRPTNGYSNEVWLTENVVLRMGPSEGGTLLREAALAAILPQEVGYPTVIGSGVLDGYEWVVAERLLGVNMGEVWVNLEASSQHAAIEDLWNRLAAIQRTDVTKARQLGCTSTPFYTLDSRGAAEQLRSASAAGALDCHTVAQIERSLNALFDAISLVPESLTHTDAHPGNMIWNGKTAIPIDFEFACVAPCDLDLENVFRSFIPTSDPAVSLYLVDLARQHLGLPGARSRLVGYAVLRDLWALNAWLRTASSREDLETWEPWLNLRDHAQETSWLAPLWA